VNGCVGISWEKYVAGISIAGKLFPGIAGNDFHLGQVVDIFCNILHAQ